MAFQILFLSLHLIFHCLILFVKLEISVLLEKNNVTTSEKKLNRQINETFSNYFLVTQAFLLTFALCLWEKLLLEENYMVRTANYI